MKLSFHVFFTLQKAWKSFINWHCFFIKYALWTNSKFLAFCFFDLVHFLEWDESDGKSPAAVTIFSPIVDYEEGCRRWMCVGSLVCSMQIPQYCCAKCCQQPSVCLVGHGSLPGWSHRRFLLFKTINGPKETTDDAYATSLPHPLTSSNRFFFLYFVFQFNWIICIFP